MSIQDQIPKSRLTLRYKTEIDDVTKDITLPMRFLVVGNFSQGNSKDCKEDLEERRTRNIDSKNINDIMKDMSMPLKFIVDNKVDPENCEDMDVELNCESLKSLEPDQIAMQIPKIKGILMVKKLLEELTSNVDNRKSFRKLLNHLMSDEKALKKMLGELKDYEGFKLPSTVND